MGGFTHSTSSRFTDSQSTTVHARYAMLNEDGSLGRQQMPWFARIWAAITWAFFTLILECRQRVFGIKDVRDEDKEDGRSRVSSAHEALELVEEDAENEQHHDTESRTDVTFNRIPSNGSSSWEKKKESSNFFSKMKKQVKDRLETARSAGSPGAASMRKESVKDELRERVQTTSGIAGQSTSSSFQSLVNKGVSASKVLRDTIQNLNERSERLDQAQDATERLADSSKGYASTSADLLKRYQGKGGFFG